MLRLKVSMEANDEHDNGDADEGRAEGLAEVAEVFFGRQGGLVAAVGGEGGV